MLLYESRYNHLFAIKTSVHQSIIPFIPKEHHKISKFERNGKRAATIFKNNLFAIKTSVHQSIMISKFEIRSYALVRISMQFLKIICSRLKYRCIKVSFHLSPRNITRYQNSNEMEYELPRFLKIISSRLKHRYIKVSFHLSSRK